jgi:hypothetical protein
LIQLSQLKQERLCKDFLEVSLSSNGLGVW